MNSRSSVFAITVVFLVPFLYVATSVPSTCAWPREQGWGASECKLTDDEKYKICCWHEPDGDMICQTCEADGTNCEPSIVVEKGSKDLQPGGVISGGGVLQEPSTDSGPKLFQKDGMVFNLPTENETAPSEQNNGTNNNTVAKDLKVPGKTKIP
ncbi:MAG TPA: hypothetical protein VJS91_04555 [Nitrososphaeraceae archaeon]|nr:hypothetical protein [Nitrososphaeraceae archaeon]